MMIDRREREDGQNKLISLIDYTFEGTSIGYISSFLMLIFLMDEYWRKAGTDWDFLSLLYPVSSQVRAESSARDDNWIGNWITPEKERTSVRGHHQIKWRFCGLFFPCSLCLPVYLCLRHRILFIPHREKCLQTGMKMVFLLNPLFMTVLSLSEIVFPRNGILFLSGDNCDEKVDEHLARSSSQMYSLTHTRTHTHSLYLAE